MIAWFFKPALAAQLPAFLALQGEATAIGLDHNPQTKTIAFQRIGSSIWRHVAKHPPWGSNPRPQG